jgi:hypothetical protein
MNLGIAECRLPNADFANQDVSWGHEPDGLGLPASAGRASIAWGAGEYLQRRGFPSDSLNVQPFPG